MKKQIYSAALYLLVSCFLFSSCAINQTISAKKLDSSIVPADFNPEKQVLLVVQINKRNKPTKKDEKRTLKMEELLKKYYPYKFEIVSPEEVRTDNAKYSDTSVFKYAVFHKLTGVYHSSTSFRGTSGATMTTGATTTYIGYGFFDRVNNNQYKYGAESPWLKTAVEAFANTVKKAKSINSQQLRPQTASANVNHAGKN